MAPELSLDAWGDAQQTGAYVTLRIPIVPKAETVVVGVAVLLVGAYFHPCKTMEETGWKVKDITMMYVKDAPEVTISF